MPNSPSRPLRVFLCHASQDKKLVREFCEILKNENWIDPWLDEEKLLPGQDWDLEIDKAIRETDAIIICLTSRSVSKEGYIQKEIKRALDIADEKPEGAIYIIPLLLGKCDVPPRLKRFHWVDLFSEPLRSYNLLLESLKLRGNSIGLLLPNASSSQTKELKESYEKPLDVNIKGGYSRSLPLNRDILNEINRTKTHYRVSVAQAVLQNLAFLPRVEIARHLGTRADKPTNFEIDDFAMGFSTVLLIGLFGFLQIEKGGSVAGQMISELNLPEACKIAIRMNIEQAMKLIRDDISATKLMLTLQYDLLISKRSLENAGIACAVDTFLSCYSEYVNSYGEL